MKAPEREAYGQLSFLTPSCLVALWFDFLGSTNGRGTQVLASSSRLAERSNQ